MQHHVETPVADNSRSQHLAAVDARLPLAIERARTKVAAAPAAVRAPQLLRAATQARTVAQRVTWLHRWADAWIEPLAAAAACRRGCAHCCHLPVATTSAEARLIARHIGRPPAALADAVAVEQLVQPAELERAHRLATRPPSPCPFLVGDECTVYAVRPMSCRLHVSLDDDALLCELVDGVEVRVPYVDARQPLALSLAAQAHERLADIRDWFPTTATGRTVRRPE